MGEKMDVPLAQLRSLLVPKFAFLAAIGLPKFIVSIICSNHGQFWFAGSPFGAKETTHIKLCLAHFPMTMENVQRWHKKFKHWAWHPNLGAWRFCGFNSCSFESTTDASRTMQSQAERATWKKFVVNSVPNFRVGYYTSLGWATQMCASQICPLTMPLAGGPSRSFWRSLCLTPFYR